LKVKIAFAQGFEDWSLFLSSYAPLLAIAAIRYDCWPLRLGLGVGALLLVGLYLNLRLGHRALQADTFEVCAVRNQGELVAGYLATYLLPFLTTGSPSTLDLCAYAVFIWVIGRVMTRARLLHVNPLVYVLGSQISSIETKRGTFYLVSRDRPRAGDSVRATEGRGRLLFEAQSPK
jgi:hypothetical protein